jgi:hypothetical protein
VILMLGGFNDLHLLTVVQRPTAAEAVQNVQLLTLGALALIGVGLLWWRWRSLPRWQRRRPAQIVINCFSLSLVMLAALMIAGAFQVPGFEILRLATFTVAGLAPLAFLAGLLDARLARPGSSVSCWYSCALILHQICGSFWPRRCGTRPCP